MRLLQSGQLVRVGAQETHVARWPHGRKPTPTWKVKVKTRDISHKVAARMKNNSNLKRSQEGYLEESEK